MNTLIKFILYFLCVVHLIASQHDSSEETSLHLIAECPMYSRVRWNILGKEEVEAENLTNIPLRDIVRVVKATDNPIFAIVHKTLKATARSCMAQVNATEADLEHLRKDPPFPEKSACIVSCLLEKIGIVDNNRFSKDGFMMTISPLVFRNKKKLDHMKTVSLNCDKEINHDVSLCQLGNEITICIFKYAPELHFKS